MGVGMTERSGLRNAVSLTDTVALDIIPSPQGAAGDGMMMSHLMQAAHAAIVGGIPLAVAFPKAEAGPNRTIGRQLRLFGDAADLRKFLEMPVVQGLALAGMIRAGSVDAVGAKGGPAVSYTRSRPEKLLPGSWDRMDKRARVRRKLGKCLMEEEDLLDRRKALAEKGRNALLLPSVMISSATTSQRFALYINALERAEAGGAFNSYGLSDGSGAVPVL